MIPCQSFLILFRHNLNGKRYNSSTTSLPRGKNLIRMFSEEEAYRWDSDGRSSLFSKDSEDYLPTGSLLKVYYYTFPSPSNVIGPFRVPRSLNDDTSSDSSNNSKDKNEVNKLSSHQKDIIMNPQVDLLAKSKIFSTLSKSSSNTFSSSSSSSSSQSSNNNLNSTLLSSGWSFQYPQQPQSFFGILTSVRRNACNSTFVLRNIIDGIGVEMTFQLFSPLLVAIEAVQVGKQRLSKWYWLRDANPKLSTFIESGTNRLQSSSSSMDLASSSIKKKLPPYIYLSKSSTSNNTANSSQSQGNSKKEPTKTSGKK